MSFCASETLSSYEQLSSSSPSAPSINTTKPRPSSTRLQSQSHLEYSTQLHLPCLFDNTMAPLFPDSKITLDYPLYACDFDPQDSTRLFVGGGGGSSRTGVGNKITSLDVSRDPIEKTGEITLSKDEDNVTALAAGQHKGKATLIYAGINSGEADVKNGKNEHFRIFGADQPKTKSVLGARISELHKSPLFTTQDPEAYQRLLRLTQPFAGASQFGAVATGFAKEAQIAMFEVAAGSNVAPKPKGIIDLTKEAVDMDVIQTADDKYQLMYCDEYNIYTLDVTKASTSADSTPKCIYNMPTDTSSEIRPSLRCIRYLSTNFAIAIANLPRPGGVVLYGFRLPKAGKPDSTARIAVSAKVPNSKGVKATGLAIANLSPVASAGTKQSDAQCVIAVAANDFSIYLYTLDHGTLGDVDLLANLYALSTLKTVHPAMITSLCFSHFNPPKSGTGRTQHLRLASTSVANSVVVHAIALKKHFDKSTRAPRRGGPPRHPRYVTAVQARPNTSATRLLFLVAGVMVFLAVLLQGVLEVKGLAKPVVAGHSWLPKSIHAVPATPPSPHAGFLARFLADRQAHHGAVVLRDDASGEVRVADPDAGDAGTAWDDLAPHQKMLWRERLIRGGYWAEDMGEKVFKGILFGELAGVVRGAVGG